MQASSYRKIIHVDMDAFYASVEQRDNPSLKGKAVIVGGSPKSRGVVSTCSYEARKYGIHSAMSCAKAYNLCPSAIFIKPNFYKYKDVSRQIRSIFEEYTDLIEPLSLDEAFLDVTQNKIYNSSATKVAQKILSQILTETRLTASAGVSYNKFLAKVASDINKPYGLTVITPDKAVRFIEKLPIRKFFGIGKVTEEKMLKLGIKTGLDLKKYSKVELIDKFGKFGEFYYDIVRGIDNRAVTVSRIRKSIGKEVTLAEDTDNIHEITMILESLAAEVNKVLLQGRVSGKTVTLKIKYHDFSTVTRSSTLPFYIQRSEKVIMATVNNLLEKTLAGQKKIRLLGISISNLDNNIPEYIQTVFPFYEHYLASTANIELGV